jgi:redox-sensing transcriptional repressor
LTSPRRGRYHPVLVKSGTRKRRARAREAGAPRRLGVSDLTAQRLSIYLRCLDDLLRAGVRTASSQDLAKTLHLNSAQIRKDLACFGGFGVRGVGYVVGELRQTLARILGLTKERRVVIIGAGNLGMALADYGGFNSDGLSITALFDSDPRKIGGVSRGGIRILDIRRLAGVARRSKVNLAVLAVPAAVAQRVLDQVVKAGIRAVLNFAPVRLRAPRRVTLKEVDLRIQMENLVFHLARSERGA